MKLYNITFPVEHKASMEFSYTTVTTIALLKEKTKNFANENISLSVSEDTMTMSVLIEIAALNDADRVINF